eukprot:TRINITY_DN6791_c0_g1_i9.p1 TRINITY_DN6791_c0_g1~~TRINITY_DN6791_c0_g1_i9.p1  ORF type:complete len:567 (+),score=95.77 TRINITY_DN6791_c0_g1_i9:777-2477(+)
MKAVLFVLFISFALGVVHRAHPCNFMGTCRSHDYQLIGRANRGNSHTITLHLRQNDFAASCPSLLAAVSDPSSPTYGNYLSFEEIRALTWDEEAISVVEKFLDDNRIPKEQRTIAPNGEYIRVTTNVGVIEKVFSAKFFNFQSVQRRKVIVRSESYTIPSELVDFVDTINGIRNFPVYSKHSKIVGLSHFTNGSVTPQLIWTTYSMPNETDSTPLADQSVFEALGQSFSPSDLNLFQQTYHLPIQKVKKVIGPNSPDQCATNPDSCGEANLDVQYIMAMAQSSPTIYWSIGQGGDIFLDFIEQVAADKNPPQVFSISYGGDEGLQDVNDMLRFNTETCKMGLRGLTLFTSSGDDGVAGAGARGNPSACGFNPQYPANCPYVTTVGATMGPESGKPETACTSNNGSIITSGGGFSNIFGRPSWQRHAVSHYLSSGVLPPSGSFNSSGRAYPDVAALGNAYNVFIGGKLYKVSGTSASSPVFCAMVSLVNGDREIRGKKPLGFLNPLLYSIHKQVFNDITVGENNCAAADSHPTCCKHGFHAAKGWDPVTGRGSIDFKRFAQILATLP